MRFTGKVACGAFFLACFSSAAMAGGWEVPDSVAVGKLLLNTKGEFEVAELLKAREKLPIGIGAHKGWRHSWYSHLMATLSFAARPVSQLTLRGSFEFRQYMNMSTIQAYYEGASYNLGDFLYHEFNLREAQGIFSLLKTDRMSIELAVGYIPYKYNQEARDLGEFLFRSGTYPFYLLTDFDRPFSRLTGLRAGVRAGDDMVGWRFDWLALTEREMRPYYHDITIAAIGGLSLMRVLDIGAGVDFAHAISLREEVTRKRTVGYPPTPSVESQYLIYNSDSTVVDAGYYTFQGTKLMARATLDPFGMFRGDEGTLLSEIAGKSGGKLYGEIAVIGLEDYPANNYNVEGYDVLKEKMPWVIGVNIPMWKLLDVCSFEIERYPNPNPNSHGEVIMEGLPLPTPYSDISGVEYDTIHAYFPRWYWSLYMEKAFIKNFSVVFQMGRDHQRWEQPMNCQLINYDYQEAMVRPDEWGWRLKFVFHL